MSHSKKRYHIYDITSLSIDDIAHAFFSFVLASSFLTCVSIFFFSILFTRRRNSTQPSNPEKTARWRGMSMARHRRSF